MLYRVKLLQDRSLLKQLLNLVISLFLLFGILVPHLVQLHVKKKLKLKLLLQKLQLELLSNGAVGYKAAAFYTMRFQQVPAHAQLPTLLCEQVF